jgi:hypothetical protein
MSDSNRQEITSFAWRTHYNASININSSLSIFDF